MTIVSETSAEPRGFLQEWREGWLVVLCAGLGYGTGGAMILLTSGLFINPMKEALGWSTSAVTIAPTVTLVWAICCPLSGAIIDRLGSRMAGVVGALGLAFCAALLSVLPVSPFTLHGVAALMGVFASLTVVPTYTRAVVGRFQRGVGLALGMTLSGSAFVAIWAMPLISTMIRSHGWQAGYLAIAGIILCVGLPAILIGYREQPGSGKAASSATAADGASVGTALRDPRFWLYTIAFSLACVAIGGFVAHLQPMLAHLGIGLTEAVSLGVVYAISASVGRIGGGILLDRVWPFGVAAGITGLAAVGAYGMAHAEGAMVLTIITAMVATLGIGQGAEADYPAFFGRRSFGMRSFSTIVGVFAMTTTASLSVGALGYGLLFDRVGDYAAACQLGAACLLASALCMVAAGFLDRKQTAT